MGRADETHLSASDITFGTLKDLPGVGTEEEKLVEQETKVSVELIRAHDGASDLVVKDKAGMTLACIPASSKTMWRSPNGNVYLLTAPPAPSSGHRATFVLRAKSPASAEALARVHEAITQGATTNDDHFGRKTDKGSAELYFHYYGMLQHQQNMLQDYIRTGTYFAAITENASDFAGKAVMDVGCGSGILSLFAAQAGARVVYAVEASNMATFAEKLALSNPALGSRIKVLHGKVEEIEIPEKVDVLVSEPMGTLLFNERMIESYIFARDRFLKPGGKMFPGSGRVHVAAFCDEILHAEVAAKASFWEQSAFYGVDLTCLRTPAAAGYFSQVVVDQIPPNVLVSNCTTQEWNFSTCTEGELHDITIPLSLQVASPCHVHGIATWFDVAFPGSTAQRYLSTAPGLPITHWFQLRCVLQRPLIVHRAGDTVSGSLRLVAHERQSYDVLLTMRAPGANPGDSPQESSGKFDLKDPYYRQLTNYWNMQPEASNGHAEGYHQNGGS